jgi:hypothetical protein
MRELHSVPVDRLSGSAAEAMKKIPSHQSSIRQVYRENNWGPTVDGRILPRHPFDPSAPEISADVPLLTGSNLHEFVNGLQIVLPLVPGSKHQTRKTPAATAAILFMSVRRLFEKIHRLLQERT